MERFLQGKPLPEDLEPDDARMTPSTSSHPHPFDWDPGAARARSDIIQLNPLGNCNQPHAQLGHL
jgi:hypothetical protein